MIVYAIPAFVVFMDWEGQLSSEQWFVEWVAYIAVIFFGTVLIFFGRTTPNEKRQSEGTEDEERQSEGTEDISAAVNAEDLRVEYQEVNAAIRYRDRHLTRLGYLALAVVGILAAVYKEVDNAFEPGVTVLGSLITLYFVVSLASMTGTLHALRDRREKIEARNEGFALNSTSRIMLDADGELEDPRPLFSQFSASTIIMYIHYLVIVIWIILYIFSLRWNLQG